MNLKITNFLVTGHPRSGKTTLLLKLKEELETCNFSVGGCLTTEIREDGRRIGFSIHDLESDKRGILAHIESASKKRVNRYGVNISVLDKIGVTALRNCLNSHFDIVIIDEIGSMELFSLHFQNIVMDLLDSPKIILGSIHYRSQHIFLKNIRTRLDTDIIEITRDTRNPIRKSLMYNILCSLTL